MTKKIVFLALHLSYGGTERAIISEANMLVKRYEVEIISSIICVINRHLKWIQG